MSSLLILLVICSFAWAAVVFVSEKIRKGSPGYSWIGSAALVVILLMWLVTTLGANH
jgi:hypothetical protein